MKKQTTTKPRRDIKQELVDLVVEYMEKNQRLPSSSKNKEGSIPSAPSIITASDQGPAGSSAVIMKL